jgi:hypothetical protein
MRNTHNVKWESRASSRERKSKLNVSNTAWWVGHNLAVSGGTYCVPRDRVWQSAKLTKQRYLTSCIQRPTGIFVKSLVQTKLLFRKLYFLQLCADLIILITDWTSYFHNMTFYPADRQFSTGCEALPCRTQSLYLLKTHARYDSVNQLTLSS